MRMKSGTPKPSADRVVRDIRRKTRKRHSAEEKIRIVLEGLRGEAQGCAADVVVYPALMQLLRGATRDGAEALNLKVAPLDKHYPNLAAWARRIVVIPGYDSAYPPHWR